MLDDPTPAAFELVWGQPVGRFDSDLPTVGTTEDQKFEKTKHPFGRS
jgi:hypothetical protein